MFKTLRTKALSTYTSVIGRYERDEMTPSTDAARKNAKVLNTTIGYLLGENEQQDLFKNLKILKRLDEIEKMEATDKGHFLTLIDVFIQSIKLKKTEF